MLVTHVAEFVVRVSTETQHTLRPIARCAEEGDADLIARALNAHVPSAIFSYAAQEPQGHIPGGAS